MTEKKRKPQDTPLRNTRATNKRVDTLTEQAVVRIAALDQRVTVLEQTIDTLVAWVGSQPKRSSEVSE